jgi:predicted CXXCH cytochrome family protein
VYNGGAGFADLLKGTVNQTCLVCHDGSTKDVVASGTAGAPTNATGDVYTSKYLSSAGFFQTDWATVASPIAHDLGPSQVTAVQGLWHSDAGGMKCTDCHDAHGTPNYRNLVLRPGTAGSDVNIVEGTDVFTDSSKTQWARRDTDAVAFNDGVPNKITTWCLGCHTNITAGDKHPQDKAISGADGTHWAGGAGVGFGTGLEDGVAGIPRVRFAQTGISYTDCIKPLASNRVFCLSCHKGHGSKYDSALVWPYYTMGDADQTSACGQCHNAGG